MFFLLFFAIGTSLATNVKGCAEAFFRFASSVMPGGRGLATPRTVRMVGSIVAGIGLIGAVTELVVLIS